METLSPKPRGNFFNFLSHLFGFNYYGKKFYDKHMRRLHRKGLVIDARKGGLLLGKSHMNEKDLEFTDYYINELVKVYPRSKSPKQKRYKNARNIIEELRDKGIIERKTYNSVGFKIKSIYIDELREMSYSVWIGRERTILSPSSPITINVNEAPISNPDKKSFVRKLFSNVWFISAVLLTIEEITLGTIWKLIKQTICSMFN